MKKFLFLIYYFFVIKIQASLCQLTLTQDILLQNGYSKTSLKLDLSFFDIQTIEISAFKKFTQITEIDLYGNIIRELEQGIFENLNHLEILNLGYNNINFNKSKHLKSETFKGAINLIDLKLNSFGIEFIDSFGFNGLTNLRYLDLSQNYLRSLDSNDVFKGLKQLQHLNLNDNLLVELKSNQFKVFKFTITNYLSLTNLSFMINSFRKIKNKYFSQDCKIIFFKSVSFKLDHDILF